MASVLITGTSSGIGRATAIELTKRGHRVTATARTLRTIEDLDVDTRLALDVSDQDSVDAAVAAAGQVDVLISNSAQYFRSAVEETPADELLHLLDVNTVGALRATRAVLPQMRRRGSGRILYVSSINGRISFPLDSAYSASKFALEAIAESLAQETATHGISVALLQPGPVASGALDAPREIRGPEDAYADLHAKTSFPGMIPTEEAAAVIADAVDLAELPLRIPVGEFARQVLAARKAAPDDRIFGA
ncbi:SDR family NAD(P)-dependent oxidoreductase [Actinoplanes palleronii]|uniref:Short-chain dehydrogenase/reductase n=1 Tax=Actinoplanes palleronii TaxID=113570 RepID=A0ABQ4BM02_9ACTN|nr:SDR family NAD(P)-dependent oxidoreductase [Actinoplanes palleronii]GIE71709.1 short-chain dehydrogenase/reductase [Actinoplanes palleronii]